VVHTRGVPLVLVLVLAAAAERTLGFRHRHGSCESALELEVGRESECRLVCAIVAAQGQELALLLVEYPLVIPGLLTGAAVVHWAIG
jgi:hypothetical protein